jgi:GntR family transcriptional repressor for pyruvate dehydrogenase complex
MQRKLARLPRLYQDIAEKLARAIAAGQFAVGERLPPERELAALHAVSRPTVREALIALELDGLIEARPGSGVYVIATQRPDAQAVAMDVGPFELTEARLIFEGEVAALAATLLTDADLADLERLLQQMERDNEAGNGEAADRLFHQRIAAATGNGAMAGVVDSLWTIRSRSPQCVRTFGKLTAKGYKPVLEEHRAILRALRARDPVAARKAMREHLGRVLGYLLDATEVEAIEATRASLAAQRRRFRVGAGQA